ncbi:MFS transporter [Slackia heliotrinireducens]|uniref:MFS transporter n=1 Tax=Slackia heliotrinireducens TaxID=84110 RepID=UPI0033159520
MACLLLIHIFLILAEDMYAPALSSMMREFSVSAALLNMTMFAFFFTMAFGIIVFGPISDRLGRRKVLIGCCVLFAICSAGCAASPSVAVLTAFRVGQAIGYGGVVTLVTAMVGDAYDVEGTKVAMTLLQSTIIIGPTVAPFLGTFLMAHWGWRSIFVLLAVLSVISVGLAMLIDETLPEQSRSSVSGSAVLHEMLGGFKTLMGQKTFRNLALFMSIAGVPYYAFIATASYVLLDFFTVTYLEYSLVYAAVSAVSIVAPYAYLVLSRYLKSRSILVVCVVLMGMAFVIMALWGQNGPWVFFAALVPFALSEGIARPLAFVILLRQPPELVGSASSLANFLYSVLTSLGTVVATAGWSNFVLANAVIMGVSFAAMAALYLVNLRRAHLDAADQAKV